MRYKGFTLAEVLITLAIIGVVAAMTVPTLMTSTRGKEYEVAAAKAMSTLSNAVTMRYSMGGQEFVDFKGSYPDLQDDMVALAYFTVPATATITGGDKITGPSGGDDGSSFTTQSISYTGAREGDQGALSVTGCNGDSCKLKDGMILTFNSSGSVAYITVDTNGEKGPTREQYKGYTNAKGCTTWRPDGVDVTSASDNNRTPTTNMCPDIVQFRVDGQSVVAANQRTRNIMATGNATIAQ